MNSMIKKCKHNQHKEMVSEAILMMNDAIERLSLSQHSEITEINKKIKILHSFLSESSTSNEKNKIFSQVVDIESDIYERIFLIEEVCNTLKTISTELHLVSIDYYKICNE